MSNPQPGGRMIHWGRMFRLCQKELRETIRDRRTIVTLLLMPVLVYPILIMALNRFLLASAGPTQGYTVCVSTLEEQAQLDAWLSDPNSLPPPSIAEASEGGIAEFRVTVIPDLTPEQAVANNDVDVGVQIDWPEDRQGPVVTFYAYRGDASSQAARRILIERLQWFRLNRAESILLRVIPRYRPPVDIQLVDVGQPQRGELLGTIVPLVLVLMTITGAVYPAIDLTAGERERGTMESVMASPIPRISVLLAKYVAVVVVALLTAVANLVAMFTTLWAGGLLAMLTDGGPFPWIAIVKILGLLVLFSGFFSAVLLSLTSFARSFKEAQAYLIPVMLLSLTPAMLALMPGATLTGPLAIVPLINIVLLARDTLSGNVDSVGALGAIISTIMYAGAALAVAGRLFGSDAVARTSEKSIGSLLRRPRHVTEHPTPSAAALMLALLVPIYFVISNGLMKFLQQVKDYVSVETQLLFNALALILSFGLVPLAAAFLGRNRLRTTYRIRRVSPVAILGSMLIGFGAWALAHEVFIVAESLGIGGLSEDKIRGAQQTIEKMRQASPWLLLAVFALAPAVIEELCFRGFLFSAFESTMPPRQTVWLTAVLFGLFHVLTGNALLIERFLPSTFMGLIIGWVALRTGSVVPGILIHFVHNGLLNVAIYYQDRLSFLDTELDNQTHLPVSWIAVASVFVAVGAGLIVWASRQETSES